jgi:hypothetical protein
MTAIGNRRALLLCVANTLQHFVLCCNMLNRVATCYNPLHCVGTACTDLQYAAPL